MASRFPAATHKNDNQGLARALHLIEIGKYIDASTLCNQMLKTRPKAAPIWGALSAAQAGMTLYTEARKSAQKGLKIDPKSVDLRIRLGLAYVADHRLKEAGEEFERALRLKPGHPWASRALADVLARSGKAEEAYALLAPMAEARPVEHRLAMAFLKACLKTRRYDEGLTMIGPLTEPEIPSPLFRSQVYFLIGDLYAALGRHDDAFAAYQTANTAPGFTFDSARNRDGVDRVIKAWTPEALARLQRPTRKTDRFVFIVGMPRSGTSLVEQIVASHPRAFGAGELDFINNIAAQVARSRDGWSYIDQLDRLAPSTLDQASQKYAEELRKMAPGADIVTDKMPSNVMQLGLIAAMLPQAKVIHCVRDPRDSCLSCYFHHFLGHGNSFTYSLEGLGEYFTDYWRLMKHWKSVLDIPILDVVYEDLVSDQEAQSRRMIDFLGLDWDDRCLAFHETKRTTKTHSADQVNKPIYSSSVSRWEPYEGRLGPLLDRLPEDALRG